MSRPTDPFDASRASRHEIVTGLQILTLTAELLALELRNGSRTIEQVQARSVALTKAMERVTRAARRIPARTIRANGGDGGSFADAESLRTIRAFAAFITRHAERPDVERDVLAEYVDRLHEQAAILIAAIDEPPGQ